MIEELTGTNPDHLIEAIRVSTVAFSKARALCDILEHGRKVALAEAKHTERETARKAGETLGRGGVTESALEDAARRSDAYRGHLKQMMAARNALAEVEAEHYALRNRWDLLRMEVSALKAEAFATREQLSGQPDHEQGRERYDGYEN